MASKKVSQNDNKVNGNPQLMKKLVDIFGEILHVDIIKSVASENDWQFEKTCKVLEHLSIPVVQNTKLKQTLKNHRQINSVVYSNINVDEDNCDADVVVEGSTALQNDSSPYLKICTKNRGASPKSVNVPPLSKKTLLSTPKNKKKPQKEINLHEYHRVRNLILTGCKVVVLVRGLPGSGKSFLAKMLITSTISEDHYQFVYSADNYFIINGRFRFDHTKLGDAHKWNQERVFEAMKMGMSPIVVDNTNTQMWEMKPYVVFAVQFGYAVEILEPCTPWMFNISELARRNVHYVDKQKIAIMEERYEKNITPNALFKAFNLQYMPGNCPPQPRYYPPVRKTEIPSLLPFYPSKSVPVAPKTVPKLIPNINQTNTTGTVSVEVKKKKPNKKKKQNSETSSVVSNLGSTSSITPLSTEIYDSDTDSWSNVNKSDCLTELFDSDSQQDLLSGDSNVGMEYVLVLPDNSYVYQKKQPNKPEVDLINFNEKNPAVRNDLINLNNIVDDNINNSGQTNRKDNQEKKTSLIDFHNDDDKKLLLNEGKSDTCHNPFFGVEIPISWQKLHQQPQQQKDDEEDKEENSSGTSPKPHREKYSKELREQMIYTDVGTNTSSFDFNLLKQNSNIEAKVIYGYNRSIEDEYYIKPLNKLPSKVLMLEKGTMTNLENLLDMSLIKTECKMKSEHFCVLTNLFPRVPQDDLKDIFEKCRGDINWAVDILLETYPFEVAAGNLREKSSSTNITDDSSKKEHIHDQQCTCGGDYEVEPYMLSSSAHNVLKDDIEENSPKKQPKAKNKSLDDGLKKHLEEYLEQQFKINDSHYSKHLLTLRRRKHGEPDPVPSTSKDNLESIFPSSSENNNVLENSSGSDVQEAEELESENEEVIELNFGVNFIEQLEKNFGNPDKEYPKGFHPVMQLPVSLARQLHTFWLESVVTQMEAQSSILETIVKEDEELARKLQEQENEQQEQQVQQAVPDLQEIMDMEIALALYRSDQEKWKSQTPDDLASKLKRQKLFETFPNLDKNVLTEILQAYGNSFEQTMEVLLMSTSPSHMHIDQNGQIRTRTGNKEINKQKELIESAKKEYIQAKEKLTEEPSQSAVENDDFYPTKQSASSYREEAAHHLEKIQYYHTKAKEAIQKKSMQVATYYSQVAKLHLQKYEHANNRAASAFLTEHHFTHQNSKTIDLHYLYVKEAEQALALFLDSHISRLKAMKKSYESLFIITGRGIHSKGGVALIKLAVKRKLKERKLGFSEMNPGLLKVNITIHSMMTNDMKTTK